MEMHYTSGYAFEGKWLERIHKYEELHGPWVDERRTGGGQAQARAASNAPVGARQQGDDVVDLGGEGEDCGVAGVEGEVEAAYSQRPGKLPVGEGGSNSGKRKGVVVAVMQQGKKMRQPTIKEVFGSDWAAQHRKLWLRFNQLPFNIFRSPTWKAYTAHFRDKPTSVPVVWPSENEVVAMDTVLQTATDVVAGLKDIQESFDRTGATIISGGRKSRDGKPIVNFLAVGARGVMMYRTLNREGETDDALEVGMVKDEDKRLVREAERYILSQTGFDERQKEYRDAVLQLRDFHMRTWTCAWGGERARAATKMCVREKETIESGLWWSQYGGCAPQLQRIALRVLYMWTCSSPSERNWAIHESIHTKKRNRLLFPKVAKLVEITANTRLLALQSSGGGFVLPWTQDESILDVEGGLEADAVCEGVDHSIPEEDRDAQAQLDDSSGDEREEADEGFRPRGAGAAWCAGDDDDTWSDPEEVRRRSGGRDLFEDTARGRFGVEGCWDGSGSPLVEPIPHTSSPVVHGAEGDIAGMRGAHHSPTGKGSLASDEDSEGRGGGVGLVRLQKGPKVTKRQLILGSESPPSSRGATGAGTGGAEIRDAGHDRPTDDNREIGTGDVARGVAWSLGDIGTLGALPRSSMGHAEQFDDAHHEGVPQDEAVGGGDHALESASMRDFMPELGATLPSMMEGESVVARRADDEDVRPRPQTVHMGVPAPDTEEERMAREVREDEEEAARAKALADADPRTQATTRDMEVMRQLETGGEGLRGDVAEDDQMEAAAHISHAAREIDDDASPLDVDSAPIVPPPPDGEVDAVAVAHDREARGETVVQSTVAEDVAAQAVAPQIVDGVDTTLLGDPRAVPGGDVQDEEAVGSPAAVGGDAKLGEDRVREVRGDVGAPSTAPGSREEEGAGVMAPPPIRHDSPTATLRPPCQRSRPPGARVSTHGLREVSHILGADVLDVLGPPRTQRSLPRRASRLDGETTGSEGLEMMRGRRRTDNLLATSQREMRLDGVTVVDDNDTDVAAEEADGEEDVSIHEARLTTLEQVGAPHVPFTRLKGDGAYAGQAGVEGKFWVMLFDVGNNSISSAGGVDLSDYPIGAKLELGEEAIPANCEIDRVNQAHFCTYVVAKSGIYTLDLEIGQTTLRFSNVDIDGGPLDTPSCIAYGPGVGDQGPIIAGTDSLFEIEAKDAKGNTLNRGGSTFDVVLMTEEVKPPVYLRPNNSFPRWNPTKGRYEVFYAPQKVGTYQLHVVRNSPIRGSPFTVSVRPGRASVATTELSKESLRPCTAGDVRSFALNAKDAYGNPTGRGGDVFTMDISATTISASTSGKMTDLGNGTYMFLYKCARAGRAATVVTVYMRNLIVTSRALQVLPGPVDAAQCEVTGDILMGKGVAGESGKLMVTARDLYGNNLVTGGLAFEVSLRHNLTGEGPGVLASVDGKDGTYTFTYNLTRAGDYVVRALLARSSTIPLGNSSTIPFFEGIGVVEAAAPDGRSTVLDYGNEAYVSAMPAAFRIYVRDRFQNLLRDDSLFYPTLLLTSVSSSTGMAWSLDRAMVFVAEEGFYNVSFTPFAAGILRISLSLGSFDGVVLNSTTGLPHVVAVLPGVVSPERTIAKGLGFDVGAVISSTAVFFIFPRDRSGNPVPPTADVVRAFSVTFSDKEVVPTPPTISSQPPSLATNDAGSIKVTYTPMQETTGLTITVAYDGIVVQNGTSRVMIRGGPGNWSPFKTVAMDVLGIEIKGGLDGMAVGVPLVFFIEPRDLESLPIVKANGIVEIGFTVIVPGWADGGKTSEVTAELQPGGLYKVSLPATSRSQRFTVMIDPLGDAETIQNGRFYVDVRAGPTSAERSMVESQLQGDAVRAGVRVVITVTARDAAGNRVRYSHLAGGDPFRATMAWSDTAAPPLTAAQAKSPTEFIAEDNNDGTHDIAVYALAAGKYSATVMLRDKQVGLPVPILVTHASFSFLGTEMRPEAQSFSSVGASVQQQMELYAYDQYKNPYLAGDRSFSVVALNSKTTAESVSGRVTATASRSMFMAGLKVGPAGTYRVEVREANGTFTGGAASSGTSATVNVISFPMKVIPGRVSMKDTTVFGSGVVGGMAGQVSVIEIVARDVAGNVNSSLPRVGIFPRPSALSMELLCLDDSRTCLQAQDPTNGASGGSPQPALSTGSEVFYVDPNTPLKARVMYIPRSYGAHSVVIAYGDTEVGTFKVPVLPKMPPRMLYARFADSLSNIVIDFDVPTNAHVINHRGSEPATGGIIFGVNNDDVEAAGVFEAVCRDIFADEVVRKLGTKPSCTFRTSRRLRIVLGSGATILPVDTRTPDVITILPDKISSQDMSSYNASGSVPVLQPVSRMQPVVTLDVPPSVGLCDPLTLDASASTGSGGRPMRFVFYVQGTGPRMNVLTRHLANADPFSSTVTVARDWLEPGKVYNFTVRATNFIGQSNSMSVMVKKEARPTPKVSIFGLFTTAGRTFYRYEMISLEARAELPGPFAVNAKGECLPAAEAMKSLVYRWFVEDGPSVNLTGLETGGRMFNLPAMRLMPSVTYVIGVRCWVEDSLDPEGDSGRSSASIVMNASPLSVAIDGGEIRVVDARDPIVIKALASDPDDTRDILGAPFPLQYSWTVNTTLADDANYALYESNEKNNYGQILLLPPNALAPGTVHRVTVMVTKEPLTRGRRLQPASVILVAIPASDSGAKNGTQSRSGGAALGIVQDDEKGLMIDGSFVEGPVFVANQTAMTVGNVELTEVTAVLDVSITAGQDLLSVALLPTQSISFRCSAAPPNTTLSVGGQQQGLSASLSIAYQWKLTSDADERPLSKLRTAGRDVDPAIEIMPNQLLGGQLYTISCTAAVGSHTTSLTKGTASTTVWVSPLPSGGTAMYERMGSSAPKADVAMLTLYRIKAFGWTVGEGEGHMHYEFRYADAISGRETTVKPMSPENSKSHIVLPEGIYYFVVYVTNPIRTMFSPGDGSPGSRFIIEPPVKVVSLRNSGLDPKDVLAANNANNNSLSRIKTASKWLNYQSHLPAKLLPPSLSSSSQVSYRTENTVVATGYDDLQAAAPSAAIAVADNSSTRRPYARFLEDTEDRLHHKGTSEGRRRTLLQAGSSPTGGTRFRNVTEAQISFDSIFTELNRTGDYVNMLSWAMVWAREYGGAPTGPNDCGVPNAKLTEMKAVVVDTLAKLDSLNAPPSETSDAGSVGTMGPQLGVNLATALSFLLAHPGEVTQEMMAQAVEALGRKIRPMAQSGLRLTGQPLDPFFTSVDLLLENANKGCVNGTSAGIDSIKASASRLPLPVSRTLAWSMAVNASARRQYRTFTVSVQKLARSRTMLTPFLSAIDRFAVSSQLKEGDGEVWVSIVVLNASVFVPLPSIAPASSPTGDAYAQDGNTGRPVEGMVQFSGLNSPKKGKVYLIRLVMEDDPSSTVLLEDNRYSSVMKTATALANSISGRFFVYESKAPPPPAPGQTPGGLYNVPPPGEPPGGSGGGDGSAKIGVILPAVLVPLVVLLAAVGAGYFYWKKRQQQQQQQQQQIPGTSAAPAPTGDPADNFTNVASAPQPQP
ncbi:hypothetical protein CBR_g31375 [Chara braunii]|uniref:HAT C-terminal dimerisation domain-containing protein n=1 Tax=Chara braunii TaxID=69332 RepID=A0A388LES6_CHABU|nr:hypothetical protein CBR_g31375 [Chara braunii]|eukprot:GBG80819.1 hypothetical protein CBR_g31375 [Chara braunii]